jgi:hypothetical protein
VPVGGGNPYLATATLRCEKPDQRAELMLRWLDDHAMELSADTEQVIPGTAWSEQFLWHVAPERATSASIELSSGNGADCEFDDAGFFSAAPGNGGKLAPAAREESSAGDTRGAKANGKPDAKANDKQGGNADGKDRKRKASGGGSSD